MQFFIIKYYCFLFISLSLTKITYLFKELLDRRKIILEELNEFEEVQISTSDSFTETIEVNYDQELSIFIHYSFFFHQYEMKFFEKIQIVTSEDCMKKSFFFILQTSYSFFISVVIRFSQHKYADIISGKEILQSSDIIEFIGSLFKG